MYKDGTAITDNEGGLVLGPSHDDRGVWFLVRNTDNYLLKGEVEGYEYIFNPGATHFTSIIRFTTSIIQRNI